MWNMEKILELSKN